MTDKSTALETFKGVAKHQRRIFINDVFKKMMESGFKKFNHLDIETRLKLANRKYIQIRFDLLKEFNEYFAKKTATESGYSRYVIYDPEHFCEDVPDDVLDILEETSQKSIFDEMKVICVLGKRLSGMGDLSDSTLYPGAFFVGTIEGHEDDLYLIAEYNMMITFSQIKNYCNDHLSGTDINV